MQHHEEVAWLSDSNKQCTLISAQLKLAAFKRDLAALLGTWIILDILILLIFTVDGGCICEGQLFTPCPISILQVLQAALHFDRHPKAREHEGQDTQALSCTTATTQICLVKDTKITRPQAQRQSCSCHSHLKYFPLPPLPCPVADL